MYVAEVGNSRSFCVADRSTLACVCITVLASSTWDDFIGSVCQMLAALITQLHPYNRVWMRVLQYWNDLKSPTLQEAVINKLRLANLSWSSLLTCSGENEPTRHKCTHFLLRLWSCSFFRRMLLFFCLELNISAGPVRLLISMAVAWRVRVLIWQPRVSKWYWTNGRNHTGQNTNRCSAPEHTF